MEIKDNEYIRAEDGTFGRVIEKKENPSRYVIDDCGQIVLEAEIVKHDKDIKRVIEKGDYINGKRIVFPRLPRKIKSILTHEQFSSLEYII